MPGRDKYPTWVDELVEWNWELESTYPVCYCCGEMGQYRYACYDFSRNWSEGERWRCQKHGHIYHGNPEWDFFEPWDFK